MSIPVIDIAALRDPSAGPDAVDEVAGAIDDSCRRWGFFQIRGHGIDAGLVADLEDSARAFFEQPDQVKEAVAMARAGSAWRGWFPVGGELTGGVPDRKEGLYVGRELPPDHPAVVAGTPLHGPNLLPDHPPEFAGLVRRWVDEMERLAGDVLRGVALGLGLAADWFAATLTADPTILFRIFHYPAEGPGTWGVAEHTDYGLLTILRQDDSGGLEVHDGDRWLPVEPRPDAFVCNLGDMIERLTGGAYRSTPHRVRPATRADGRGRLSFPFFYDPSWDAHCEPLPAGPARPGRPRWDGNDPIAFEGRYGDYLTAKVAKVFPDLPLRVPRPPEPT